MRKPLLVASVLVHAAAFTALALAAMWRIEKLPLEDRGGVVASFMLPQDTGGGAAPNRPELKPRKKPRVKPKDVVQPQKIEKDEVDPDPDHSQSEILGNSTSGEPGNGLGGDGKGKLAPTGDCATPPCDGPPADEPIVEKKKEEKKVEKKKPITIAESKLRRVSGNARIEAPNPVKVSMQRAGDDKVVGTIKVCGDERGRVVRTSVAKSTGYDAYDDKLASEMSDWRYEPPRDEDGEPTAFCTFVTLVYIMR
jgi:hypothetical protein